MGWKGNCRSGVALATLLVVGYGTPLHLRDVAVASWQPVLLVLSTELIGVAGRRRLLGAQPGGLTLGFALHLHCESKKTRPLTLAHNFTKY